MRDLREVWSDWLRATPALDRIEYVDTFTRPDGEPRKLGELRDGTPYTGSIVVLRRET